MTQDPALALRPPDIAQDRPFWHLLLTAMGLMTLSGAILIGGFLAYHFKDLASFESQPRVWFGEELQIIEGEGARAGGALAIDALSPGGQAIVSSGRITLAAEHYPVLKYRLKGSLAAMNQVFFWRREAEPEKLISLPLEGRSVLRLAHHNAWRGDIIEFGIGLRGVLPEPVIINAFVFKPDSVATLLAGLWSDWTAFKGWSQRSINFIEGGARNALIPPVSAVAAWVALAMSLYGIGGLFLSRRRDWRIIGVIFLLGWLALDSRWQVGLWHQLQETHERYAGKDWQEKRLAAEDSALFKFITGVKAQLPTTPQRIFLVVARSLKEDAYTRSRARYHLLPHNVHDHGIHLPGQKYVRAGDYVLLLGPPAELSVNTKKQFFRWHEGKKNQWVLKKIHAASMGILYKVLAREYKSIEYPPRGGRLG